MLNTSPMPAILRRKKIVDAGQTTAIEQVAKSVFSSIKYNITAFNESENKYFTCELVVTKTAEGIRDVLSNKINLSSLQFEINSIEDSTNFYLSVTNNESHNLVVSIARLTLKA